VRALLILIALGLFGCGAPPPGVPATGRCSIAERTLIGTEYAAELLACGAPCPRFNEITARRDARRKAWNECLPP
jgi:hypothetical protein